MIEFLLVMATIALWVSGVSSVGAALAGPHPLLILVDLVIFLAYSMILLTVICAYVAGNVKVLVAKLRKSYTPHSDEQREQIIRPVYRVFYWAVISHTVIAVFLFEPTVSAGNFLAPVGIALAWTKLAATLLLPVVLHWREREIRPVFALVGAAAAALVFAAAWFYAPSLYGWDLRPGGWYGILVTAVPMLLFLSLLLRRYLPLFARRGYLRHGLTVGLFLIIVVAAWQTALAGAKLETAAGADFGRKLDAALDSGADVISFAALTDFDWDRVEIYRSNWSIAAEFSPPVRNDIDLVTRSAAQITWYDGWNFIVFIKNERVVYYEIIGSDRAYFSWNYYAANPIVATRPQANFTLAFEDLTGRFFIKLLAAP